MPTATTAAAFGASRSSHSLVVIGWPVSGSSPIAAQWPSPERFSFGIEPSTTRTNGSSSPRSACHHASMNSAPFSKASTGLWTITFGIPGIDWVMMSSRLGLTAEVIATESPSHERPLVIQRTWASTASVAWWGP